MQDLKAAISVLSQALQPIRGLWPGIAEDLAQMGIRNLGDLAVQDPADLARQYCTLTGRTPDPVIEACFVSLSKFAADGVTMPWWLILRESLRSEMAQLQPRLGR